MIEYQWVTYEPINDARYAQYLQTGTLPTEEEKQALRPRENTECCSLRLKGKVGVSLVVPQR
eukprot:6483256-Prorocentrum_lima.AAC.1